MTAFLPDQTRITQVHLRTSGLERSLAFYRDVLGLKARQSPRQRAALSVGGEPDFIMLSEERKAAPQSPDATGLGYFALRYPGPVELARTYRHLVSVGYPDVAVCDHGVSEAIRLKDPDGNGLELYADCPSGRGSGRDDRRWMAARALDPRTWLELAADGPARREPPLPLQIGHIHLRVPDLAAAERFYADFLGLAVTQRSWPGTLFFAAGPCHHHLAVDLGTNGVEPQDRTVGLISYRLEVPVGEILYCLNHRAPLLGYEARNQTGQPEMPILQIRDPSGTWLEIQPRRLATRGTTTELMRTEQMARG